MLAEFGSLVICDDVGERDADGLFFVFRIPGLAGGVPGEDLPDGDGFDAFGEPVYTTVEAWISFVSSRRMRRYR